MSAAVTKEGIEVRVGQIWRDLDKRMAGRICEVVFIDAALGKAHMLTGNAGGRVTKVSIARMRKGATGWALASDPKASKP